MCMKRLAAVLLAGIMLSGCSAVAPELETAGPTAPTELDRKEAEARWYRLTDEAQAEACLNLISDRDALTAAFDLDAAETEAYIDEVERQCDARTEEAIEAAKAAKSPEATADASTSTEEPDRVASDASSDTESSDDLRSALGQRVDIVDELRSSESMVELGVGRFSDEQLVAGINALCYAMNTPGVELFDAWAAGSDAMGLESSADEIAASTVMGYVSTSGECL